MVKACCAVGCHNREDKASTLHFYRIPAENDRRAQWLAAIHRENWQPTEYTRLCSCHFISGEKSDNPLSPDFVPSVFAHISSSCKRRKEQDLVAFERRQSLKKKKFEAEKTLSAAEALLQLRVGKDSLEDPQIGTDVEIGTQTDFTANEINTLINENQKLREENLKLQDRISNNGFDISGFENNDLKVKNVTGLPSFSVLFVIFKTLENFITKRQTVSKFQQLIITLMRMKHCSGIEFVACLFGVSDSTVSRIFLDTVGVMYNQLVPLLVFWPDKDVIKQTLPMCFRNSYKNCVSIIDCFEVFCERPSDLQARAQTYSQYKSHNTVKYLISITPQGFISYISKGWGGRTSDKHLTEQSGYINFLLPGDTVLADRGFDIQDSIAVKGANLEIPAFTKGKSQLDSEEVETTRKIASVRIHVERVIGNLRQKYNFLNSIVAIKLLQNHDEDTVTTLDKIVHVACALCNACTSVVPTE